MCVNQSLLCRFLDELISLNNKSLTLLLVYSFAFNYKSIDKIQLYLLGFFFAVWNKLWFLIHSQKLNRIRGHLQLKLLSGFDSRKRNVWRDSRRFSSHEFTVVWEVWSFGFPSNFSVILSSSTFKILVLIKFLCLLFTVTKTIVFFF